MSFLIKGMEMPTRCGRCDLRIPVFDDGIFDHYECCITAAVIDNLGEKMDDCPLVHVPPHGLIDREQILDAIRLELAQANAVNDMEDYDSWVRVFDYVRKFPVIIPAEEGE